MRGEKMAEIIAVINQKGGIGKTTTTYNLGAGLAMHNKDVLLIDLDTQGNLSFYALKDYPGAGRQKESIVDVVNDGADFDDVIQSAEGLDIIPASVRLVELDGKIAKFNFKKIAKKYDYILMDCPPNMAGLTVAAIKASDSVLIPTTPDVFAFSSVQDTAESIKTLEKKIRGIVIIKYSERMIINKDIKKDFQSLAKKLKTKLYKTAIRETVAVRESQVAQQNIFSYAPDSTAAADFEKFSLEFMEG